LQGRNGTCTRGLPCPFAASSKPKIQRPRRSNTNIKEKGKRKGGNKAANKEDIRPTKPIRLILYGLKAWAREHKTTLAFFPPLGGFLNIFLGKTSLPLLYLTTKGAGGLLYKALGLYKDTHGSYVRMFLIKQESSLTWETYFKGLKSILLAKSLRLLRS
jgi:hypothetical protein